METPGEDSRTGVGTPTEEGVGPVVLRVHRVRNEVVVAACDADLVDTFLMVGKSRVPVSAQFYGRRRVSREEFLRAVRLGTIVNLLGTETVTMAVAEGLLEAGAVGTLGGIPHAEIVQM